MGASSTRILAGSVLLAASAVCFAVFGACSTNPSSETAALAGALPGVAGLALLVQGIIIERRQRRGGE